MEKKSAIGFYLMVAFAWIAYCIGSNFGSGQEILQWFGSHGTVGIPSSIINSLLVCSVVVIIVMDCKTYGLKDANAVFDHYCGKYLGKLFFIYTAIFIFGMACLMCAGAGATLNQFYGWPTLVGRVIMAVLVLVTILLGLRKTISSISFVGPVILAFVLLVAIVNIFTPANTLAEGNRIMLESETVVRAGSNWMQACFLYFTYALLVQIPYVAGFAHSIEGERKKMVRGFILGGCGMALSLTIVVLAYLLNAELVAGTQVPILTMATNISPVLGAAFGFVLLGAIYTTAAPMAWSSVTTIFPEENKYYKPAVVVCCVLMAVLSGVGPFSTLVNYVSTISGWVGLAFLVPVAYTKLIRRPKAPENAEE
ncbi:MAG: hypothetical protein J6T26_05535 [Firmicutes bacterium]|nr:hypothetical protein [Bacillota bacterium]